MPSRKDDADNDQPLIPIEIESESNEPLVLDNPFNPNDININIVPRTIGQLVDMLDYGEILVPKYQRLPDLWNDKKKSRFIESLMLNLPIPLFYFDEGNDKKWRVIDGLQRISTLEQFILATKDTKNVTKKKASFVLQDLEFRKEFNGRLWEDLPREVQRRISTNQVTINLIGKGTPDQVKFNIFSRINSGGIELTPQEIRTALFQGYRTDYIEEFVSDETEAGKSFLRATSYSVPFQRQDDLDFVTRFLSFYLIGYEKYEPDMDNFLTLGTKNIPENSKSRSIILKEFTKSMDMAYEIFGKYAFRKLVNIKDRRKPINKSLFEIVSVQFAKLNDEERDALIKRKTAFLSDFMRLNMSDRFFSSISTGTAAKERVKQRHEDFEELINSFLQ